MSNVLLTLAFATKIPRKSSDGFLNLEIIGMITQAAFSSSRIQTTVTSFQPELALTAEEIESYLIRETRYAMKVNDQNC